MRCNGKVFISHSHADNAWCEYLLPWLKGWGIPFWFDRQTMPFGGMLAKAIEQALCDHDVLLRVCSVAAQRSLFVGLEREVFIHLMAEDYRAGFQDKRKLINLIVDPGYAVEHLDYAFPFILATPGTQPQEWLEELRRALTTAFGRPLATNELPASGTAQAVERAPFSSGALSTSEEEGVTKFIDDDAGYLAWINNSPAGYVLNCNRQPKPNYLMLHRSTCHTISGTPARKSAWHGTDLEGNVWTSAFIKVCSLDRSAIERWANRKTGGAVRACLFCRP